MEDVLGREVGRGQRLCYFQDHAVAVQAAVLGNKASAHFLDNALRITRQSHYFPYRIQSHITPNPALSSLARSSIPIAFGSSATTVFASFKHLSQQHFPKPQALNSSCRCLYPRSGFTYVTNSSSPTLMGRCARTVMRESALRWSR